MFRLLYLWLEDPPTWLAYVQFLVMAGLMGLTYVQVTRRRMSFMIIFLVMMFIFFIDILAYLPFLAYLRVRDRRVAAACK